MKKYAIAIILLSLSVISANVVAGQVVCSLMYDRMSGQGQQGTLNAMNDLNKQIGNRQIISLTFVPEGRDGSFIRACAAVN